MKKSLVALAVLGSIAGTAAAQSSVTLFGVVDAAARYTSANDKHIYALASSGNTTSRFGVRGVEDLGGGLKAGFWLESQVGVDTGAAGSNNAQGTNAFWGRRSTVSLWGDFGEIRLGRFKNSTKLAYEDFDPTSAIGLGSVETLFSKYGQQVDYGRYDNQVTYVLPGNLGGAYGSVDIAAGEGVNYSKSYSGRVGYKDNAVNVSAAYMESGVVNKYKLMTLGGSYDFGSFKPILMYTTTELGARKQGVWMAAVTVPVGNGQFWASYSDSADKSVVASTSLKASQLSGGYTYNLSKRTALYTVVSLIDNGKQATFALSGSPAVAAGGRSGGYDVGLRHSF